MQIILKPPNSTFLSVSVHVCLYDCVNAALYIYMFCSLCTYAAVFSEPHMRWAYV